MDAAEYDRLLGKAEQQIETRDTQITELLKFRRYVHEAFTMGCRAIMSDAITFGDNIEGIKYSDLAMGMSKDKK